MAELTSDPPQPPAALRSRIWAVTKRMWTELHDDGLFDAAAGVAFWLILSLPAALLAGLSSVSLLGEAPTADLKEVVDEFVTRTFATESETISTAVDGLFNQSRPGVLSVSVAVAIFTLSRGFAGLIRALDVAYDIVESRRFIRLRATAVAMAIGTIATVAGATGLWVTLGDVGMAAPLRFLVALAVLIAWAATLFHVGPHHRTPWRYDVPGAALTAIGWLTLSLGFGYYVRVAASGNEIVGAAGAALLALTWLWLACLVFLIGAELNQILSERAGVVRAPLEFGVDLRRMAEDRFRAWRSRR